MSELNKEELEMIMFHFKNYSMAVITDRPYYDLFINKIQSMIDNYPCHMACGKCGCECKYE